MANFYRKPFIYLPRKKKIEEQGSQQAQVGIPETYDPLAILAVSNTLVTFWTTPMRKRTPTTPELTLEGSDIYFNTSWSTTGSQVVWVNIPVNLSDTNINNFIWAAYKYNTPCPYIYIYKSSEQKLYKVISSTQNYQMVLTTGNSTVQMTVNGVSKTYNRRITYLDENVYKAFRDNAAVQSLAGDRVFYLSHDLPDSEVINLANTYGYPTTAMDTISI